MSNEFWYGLGTLWLILAVFNIWNGLGYSKLARVKPDNLLFKINARGAYTHATLAIVIGIICFWTGYDRF